MIPLSIFLLKSIFLSKSIFSTKNYWYFVDIDIFPKSVNIFSIFQKMPISISMFHQKSIKKSQISWNRIRFFNQKCPYRYQYFLKDPYDIDTDINIFKNVLIDIDIFKSVDISTINISYRYIEQGLTETPQKAYLIYGRRFISKWQ